MGGLDMATGVILLLLWGGAMAGSSDSGRDEAIRLAKGTLSRTLAVGEGDLQLEEAVAVDWPDASLGCPQAGMAYAQMITPGYKVTLRAGDASHEVHVAGAKAVICSKGAGRKEPPLLAGAVAKVFLLARQDLAARLKVPEKDVEAVFVRPTTWPDTSLGCPQPGESYEPAPTKGFLIELRHAAKAYRYHADMVKAVACEKPSETKGKER